jgi:hypothetical protein
MTSVEVQPSEVDSINVNTLAELTGFPLDLIQKELLLTDEDMKNGVSIEILRERMLKYIDQTMMSE